MRFFTALTTFGLVALVAAQSATSASGSTSVASASSTASLSPQAICLQQCGSADVCCQAACVDVPCPSDLQANATTECAAQCPQGNGTASETQEYASCQASCVSSYFMSSTVVTPTATASGSGASSTSDSSFGGSTATTTGASASATDGSSETGAGASATGSSDSDNGANGHHVGAVGVGFLALVIAGLVW
ncbi:uncharacterized protein Z518_00332 [Rhinocladiella mackenziei CBS 650.93]|uniref:Extracellular membrane protein CFEM domain-containing protein n=1 Tax=Rhinocladiella mackenziei CBS 650.93 TaxID=1442369 RepID=A0A0D2HEY3_9EURO|nr:uncharacterized protein Z518_00332 [Rhinocladiella mackenziei CBS 650.93]KIX09253.1 hypothetical protein Z518_00332 [Rhinocladiella mackenziei CBS 650.93]